MESDVWAVKSDVRHGAAPGVAIILPANTPPSDEPSGAQHDVPEAKQNKEMLQKRAESFTQWSSGLFDGCRGERNQVGAREALHQGLARPESPLRPLFAIHLQRFEMSGATQESPFLLFSKPCIQEWMVDAETHATSRSCYHPTSVHVTFRGLEGRGRVSSKCSSPWKSDQFKHE